MTHSLETPGDLILKSSSHKALKKLPIYLHFESHHCFKGEWLFGETSEWNEIKAKVQQGIWGEAAFTTGMSGYVETMTDPSFLGQHIIFTHPHIGNYPFNPTSSQSKNCHAKAIFAREFSLNPWLLQLGQKRPLISNIDTRSITRFLASSTHSSISLLSLDETPPSAIEFKKMKSLYKDHLELNQVSTSTNLKFNFNENEIRPPIVVIDYGIKKSIIDIITSNKYPTIVLPYNVNFEEIISLKPILLFLSNGPGDPREYHHQIETIKDIINKTKIPIRGICLGHQLISLALGVKVVKLPFGQRGINHPVMDHLLHKVLITSQNHGYAIDTNDFLEKTAVHQCFISHTSLFDHSIEGIKSFNQRIASVQYHPEANPGPQDAQIFFDDIEHFIHQKNLAPIDQSQIMPYQPLIKREKKNIPFKKILLIGSGPIKIGQASEFDYSGTQALKALQEEQIETILLNSNPATIMTDPNLCSKTFLEPITKDVIKKIIMQEKVDALLSTMGGQTALNLCVELEDEGFLKEYGVTLLGSNSETIKKTEDRNLFSIELAKLGYHAGKRFNASNEQEAISKSLSEVGFPLIISRDFALGGKGSALIYNLDELKETLASDIKYPITLEKSLVGQKEVELEVMSDKYGQAIIVCSIENVDPCGIHTGDSITVAPAQTLSDQCMQKLRTMTLTIAKHMGLVAGGANVQFAINPKDENDITVIEMNPRVSRSSALASKATGYPIAKISTLLSLGYGLHEILNDITKVSPVSFEPTLDYVAIKIPLFPFNKFPQSKQTLGPQMRSVGEVLSLGATFNEAFLKALRMKEMGLEIPTLNQLKTQTEELTLKNITQRLQTPHELSLLSALDGLRLGMNVEEISYLTHITPWFIEEIQKIIQLEKQLGEISKEQLSKNDLITAKKMGLSDKYIAFLLNTSQQDIFERRFNQNIFPVYKAVDTCAGEFKAQTPYFYSTYHHEGENEARSFEEKSIAILGSGPNRIGQGIEFDYSCVKASETVRDLKLKSIFVNSNPETVSTDYDHSDRLYLAPLYSEDLMDIFLNEKPHGIIASFSGQTGIAVREHLEKSFRADYINFNFLGSNLKTLELTEDRQLFSQIIKDTELSITPSAEIRNHKELINAITEIGFPIIMRPSFVIGGESMYIFKSKDDLNDMTSNLKDLLQRGQTKFLVERYLERAIEYDVDVIIDQFNQKVIGICEHIEYAGVHSGDSGMITPPVILTDKLQHKMERIAFKLCELLNVKGPINFQFAIKDEEIYCIEANPRGSRTLPFLSKAYQKSFPTLATYALLGEKMPSPQIHRPNYFSVKQSTFPFDRFLSDNLLLGPKMRSTGETMGIDYDKDKAILKSYRGNYPKLDLSLNQNKILLSLADGNKEQILTYLKPLTKLGMQFLATEGTYHYIQKQGIKATLVEKVDSQQTLKHQSIPMLEVLKDDQLLMVLNTPLNKNQSQTEGELIRNLAILYGVPCFTRIENIKAVLDALIGCSGTDVSPIALQELSKNQENLL